MKPFNVFFIFIVYLSQSFSAIADPALLKTGPQQTSLSNGNLTQNGVLLVHNEPKNSSNLRNNLLTQRPREGRELKKQITAEEAIYRAYLDTFYYRIDPWILIFKEKIAFLESTSQNIETQLELMKYYFNLGGLYVELSHIMGFNSKYKIREIENEALLNTHHAKRLTKEILARKGLTSQQRAEAHFYLGASEGSLGVLEFRAGNIFSALINGFQADNHLEKALILDPNRMDAHLGLGIYRYGNSRLGGLSNLILQAGRDQRQVGLSHIERSIRADGNATPLAIKTLAWFHIAVQINPENEGLPKDHPLSPISARTRAHELFAMMENRYFKNPPVENFIGNKEFAMMKAIQFVLDGEYAKARDQFEKILQIIDFLGEIKGHKVNPQQRISIREGINFCEAMLLASNALTFVKDRNAICLKLNREVVFLSNGGRILEYDVEKLRDEINAVFYRKLISSSKKNCEYHNLDSDRQEYMF